MADPEIRVPVVADIAPVRSHEVVVTECPQCFALISTGRVGEHLAAAHGGKPLRGGD
jgi:hypothetical protein